MSASEAAAGSRLRASAAGLYAPVRGLVHEIAKFGIVGLTSLVIDVSVFNLLLFGGGPLEGKPLTAKAVSVAVATTFAYFGNRYWTFRHRGRTNMGREYVLFFLLNGVAMLIAVACLWISHYVLELTSPIADNISANVVGLALGTLFRFWSYRKWVFPAVPAEAADRELAERDAATPICVRCRRSAEPDRRRAPTSADADARRPPRAGGTPPAG